MMKKVSWLLVLCFSTVLSVKSQITPGTSSTPTNELTAGKNFLLLNGKRKGVTTTASGLQYEVVRKGKGAIPTISDEVKVHYRGSLRNGESFDNSYDRGEPLSLPVNAVISGWQEGLQLMPAGSYYKFYIPAALGYGADGAGGRVKPNSVLIFDVELLAISGQPAPPAEPANDDEQDALEKTITAIIADGKNDFIKRGAPLPKGNFESAVDSSFTYSLTLGGIREKLRWDGIMSSYSFSSSFNNAGEEQQRRAIKLKAALDAVSETFVQEKKGRRETKGEYTYLKNNNGDGLFYYKTDKDGNLAVVYFNSTSTRQLAKNKESQKSFEANAKDPAVQEAIRRLNFTTNSGMMREFQANGFKRITTDYLNALKANPGDWPAVKKSYRLKAENELTLIESNYKNWEKFLDGAKTISKENIAKDRISIAQEKEFVEKRRKMIPELFAE